MSKWNRNQHMARVLLVFTSILVITGLHYKTSVDNRHLHELFERNCQVDRAATKIALRSLPQ